MNFILILVFKHYLTQARPEKQIGRFALFAHCDGSAPVSMATNRAYGNARMVGPPAQQPIDEPELDDHGEGLQSVLPADFLAHFVSAAVVTDGDLRDTEIAGAENGIGVAVEEWLEEFGILAGVVFEIGVLGARSRPKPLDGGADGDSLATVLRAPVEMNLRKGRGQTLQNRAGAVGGTSVDDDPVPDPSVLDSPTRAACAAEA
ncbi:MAG TPA: hypothetical protein VNY05_44600 [Candidatus Acidoferrales bacterium]|nr:hypothetical protein [Candidatus Acidoferrales bacterium]